MNNLRGTLMFRDRITNTRVNASSSLVSEPAIEMSFKISAQRYALATSACVEVTGRSVTNIESTKVGFCSGSTGLRDVERGDFI